MKIVNRFLATMMTVILLFMSVSSANLSLAAGRKVSSVRLNKTSLTLYVGDTYKIVATVLPENATNRKLTWSTADKNILTVSSGKVTAKKAGTVTVTAKATDGSGKKATCKVTVKKRSVKSVKLNRTKVTIYLGDTLNLKATVSPSDATNKKVTWKSGNTKVASVSSSGKVTGKGSGKTTVTVTAADGGKKAACTVVVKKYYKVPGSDISVAVNTPIWIPVRGGTKFHIKPNCSNMKNPDEVRVRTAVKRGFEPCKKCFR